MSDLIVQLGLTGGAAWSAKKLLGPALDAAGADISDFYKSFKMKNLQSIFAKAELILKTLGDEEREGNLSPKLLISIIEKASLEDDDVLQDLWARVLATASSDNEADSLFLTQVLSLMTRREAEFFDRFCSWSNFKFSDVEHDFSILQNPYADTFARLVGLPLPAAAEAWQDSLNRLWQHNFLMPARVVQATVPQLDGTALHNPTFTAIHYNLHRKSFDVLSTVGLLRAVTSVGIASELDFSVLAFEITRIDIELRKRTLRRPA